MNKTNYISNAELQAYAPDLDVSAFDAPTLSGIISQACDFADEYVRYTLGIEQIINEEAEAVVNPDGDLMLFPRKIPVRSLEKLEIKLGVYNTELVLQDNTQSVNPNLYDIPTPGNYILYPYQQLTLTGKVGLKNLLQVRTRRYFTRISYTAGYEEIPSSIKRAIILLVRDILAVSANPTGANSMSQGGISVGYGGGFDEDNKLVRQAKQLLDKYVRRWE